jgi:hypothetical protein
MNNFFNKYWVKIFNNKKYNDFKFLNRVSKDTKNFKENFENQINSFQKAINTKEILNFLHCGHVGDIINVLPAIKELAKEHTCNLYIKVDAPLKSNYHRHPANNVFINKKIFNMLKPLLDHQSYINKIEIFNNQPIDINFDIIREIPINLLFDNTKYSFHITGLQPDLSVPYLDVNAHSIVKQKVVIQRTFRYRNPFINYEFLNNYENLLFIGAEDEFNDMKLVVKNLEYYDCKDFLEVASVIMSCKLFIANSSSFYPIAEALKVPRLLEACPYFPAAQTHGKNGFDFYFQIHFEKWFKYLYCLK